MTPVRFGGKSSSRNLLRWVANNADCFHNPTRKRGILWECTPLAYRLVALMDLGSKSSGIPPGPRAGGGLDWVSIFRVVRNGGRVEATMLGMPPVGPRCLRSGSLVGVD